MRNILAAIIKESDYKLTQFSDSAINAIEQNIVEKDGKLYIKCLVRKKDVRLTPEEIVRQLYIDKLIHEYGYPVERMELERAISFGTEKKRADVVIFNKNNVTSEEIIVELKKQKLKDGKDQLKSYCNETGEIMGVCTNVNQITH